MTRAGVARGARRDPSDGRFLGRFSYEERNPLGLEDHVRTHRTYLVTRVSDGRQLGAVHHRLGTSWWTAQPQGVAEELPGRQARREWAADLLDAYTQRNLWCACGVVVGTHDRPTRAAMRSWAYNIDRMPDQVSTAAVEALAWQAAYHARIRGRDYDIGSCVVHARQFATAAAPNSCRMVKPDAAPRHGLDLWVDPLFGGVVVRHTLGGKAGSPYDWPDGSASLERVRDVHLGRGFVEAYDWRQ